MPGSCDHTQRSAKFQDGVFLGGGGLEAESWFFGTVGNISAQGLRYSLVYRNEFVETSERSRRGGSLCLHLVEGHMICT